MKTTLRAALVILVVLGLVRAARPEPEAPATVKLDRPGLACEMTFEDGTKFTTTSEGAPIKAGTYWLKSLRWFKKDDKGRVWELQGIGELRYMQVLIAESGQVKLIQPGPPIRMAVSAQQGKDDKAGTMGIALYAVGRYSEHYWPGALVGGKYPPGPALRILAADGKMLLAGQFQVTAAGTASFVWNIPAGFKGKVRFELQPVMGPFEWVFDDREVTIE